MTFCCAEAFIDSVSFSWMVAAATFAGSVVSIILVARRTPLAPVVTIATGVIALFFFASLPVLLMSGAIVSLLAVQLGMVAFLMRVWAACRQGRGGRLTKSMRVRPPAYYLSESGKWRLYRPVDYLSESGVWRERPVNRRRRDAPRLKVLG